MTESINPYQAPLEDSLDNTAKPSPRAVIPSRLEFEGELTLEDIKQAVQQAGLRTEYRGTTRVLYGLVVLYSLPLIGAMLVARLPPSGGIRYLLALAIFAVGAITMSIRNRWILATLIPENQLGFGRVKGWLDATSLHCQYEHFTTRVKMSQLISTAAGDNVWVLNFTREQFHWTTLPYRLFSEPESARTVAEDLRQLYPPVVAQAMDERKFEPPTDPPLFEAAESAVHYDGTLLERSVKGTRFQAASRRLVWGTWATVVVFFVCVIASLVTLMGFQQVYVAAAVFWLIFFVVLTWSRTRAARRKARGSEGPAVWHSKGWLDDSGFCSMTVLGQSWMQWAFFDHVEITENVIAMYPHPGDSCCCLVGRNQFVDDRQWHAAQEIARRNLARDR
ncbi:hypothetical protein FYK55_00315 [Roseiconus nitratireducens]|uniref:YcxB-like protein domain-containing protein n=1 Tax=Roseiconus nitratireducens TaxID=2605748 RepID=A0A5M6DL02_9BACT|nr:hypothetical protein FYK55_00315 [Roseiconus nitratireducens]